MELLLQLSVLLSSAEGTGGFYGTPTKMIMPHEKEF